MAKGELLIRQEIRVLQYCRPKMPHVAGKYLLVLSEQAEPMNLWSCRSMTMSEGLTYIRHCVLRVVTQVSRVPVEY